MILRPNTTDENVYREVITENCYRVEAFQPADVVIDIGAHVGCFSRLCADLGAKTILAFEIEPENVEIATKNLADYPQVQLFHKAVWKPTILKVGRSGMYLTADALLKNTGSSHVTFASSAILNVIGDVDAITLDEIMAPYDQIELVKMDCEGSEFEIVPATRDWNKVQRLVGEVHGFRKEYHVPDFYMEVKKHFPKLEVNSYCPEYGLETFFASR